jgi:hypothetical protein
MPLVHIDELVRVADGHAKGLAWSTFLHQTL